MLRWFSTIGNSLLCHNLHLMAHSWELEHNYESTFVACVPEKPFEMGFKIFSFKSTMGVFGTAPLSQKVNLDLGFT